MLRDIKEGREEMRDQVGGERTQKSKKVQGSSVP